MSLFLVTVDNLSLILLRYSPTFPRMNARKLVLCVSPSSAHRISVTLLQDKWLTYSDTYQTAWTELATVFPCFRINT